MTSVQHRQRSVLRQEKCAPVAHLVEKRVGSEVALKALGQEAAHGVQLHQAAQAANFKRVAA